MKQRIAHSFLLLTSCLLFSAYSQCAKAQVWDVVATDSVRIDSAEVGTLRVGADALGFFQNNEYSSDLMKGYTLPGAWLRPQFSYTPLPQVRIVAGAHLMFYDGANRYPNYAYHDIATWKGHQYQHGVHALPFLRLQAQLRNFTIIVGDIYSAQNHQLLLPMFNPEQALSADPEMGFQFLLDRKHIHLDTWINWQSYIFDLDSHQEAFTVGINSTLRWGNSDRLLWEVPLQVILQHRGGEQDTTATGVQTVANGAAGVRLTHRYTKNHLFTSLRAEANVLGSLQQHGHLWPFRTGFAFHTALRAQVRPGVGVEAGYFGAPRQYANLFGLPLFGTISLKHQGVTFHGVHTPYASLSYVHCFTPAYRIGAQFNIYTPCSSNASNSCLFDFGIYLRVSPDFLLWRKKPADNISH